MDETAKAYMAGLIDGEGSICIWHPKTGKRGKNTSFYLQIGVGMTDKKAPELLHKSFGGSLWERVPQQQNHKHQWIWSITGDAALGALKSILPYLITKRPQALLGIKFRENWQDQRRYGNKGSLPQVVQRRQEFYEQMKLLNS